MKRFSIILLVFFFSFSFILPSFAYYLIPEYLCESGIQLYNEGKYAEALQKFNKALLSEPEYQPALEYINKIKELQSNQSQKEEGPNRPSMHVPFSKRDAVIEDALNSLGKKTGKVFSSMPSGKKKIAATTAPRIVSLNDLLVQGAGVLEIEQGKSLNLYAKEIQRYLVTEPDTIRVRKENPGVLSITGNNIGYTYLHIWDSEGRRTVEILVLLARPEGESLEEKMRLEQQKEKNFQLFYSVDWSDYASGSELSTLKRSAYYYIHNLKLTGETPYGDLDSSLAVNKYNTRTDLTHYTIGLTNGKFGDFDGFTLRGFDFFDYPPDFSNLSFPGTPLRGAMMSSPAFNHKLNYTVFYGQQNWSGFSGLSPQLNQNRKVYLEGLNLTFSPTDKQNYRYTVLRGWGEDRDPALKPFGYDAMGDWLLGRWRLGYELASDTEHFANLLNIHYVQPNLSLGAQLRDIDKNFMSITGSGWNQGQLGGLFTFNSTPMDKLEIESSLDLYQDRLYPAPNNRATLNEDFTLSSRYRINPLTSLLFNYTLQNELGRISQYRYQSIDTGINRTYKFFKDVNVYIKYGHQENTNFSSPASDYGNERVYAGFKINLTRDLYYYANAERNWLTERSTGARSNPSAFETGLDWSGPLKGSSWFGVFRLTYRNEQDTSSNLSFLSGEDYVEGYSELSYRPNSDVQIYCSSRLRDVWPGNSRVTKRIEVNFNAGMRFLWDTGFRWEAVGEVEGVVFKDLNSDGMMQKGEPAVKGVKIWLGKNRSTVTDASGHFSFKNVRGNLVYVNLDTATIPDGFVLVVPASRSVSIRQGKLVRVNFGIVSRSEIFGYVFEDVNGDNQYGKGAKGVRNAVVMLEDGTKRTTDYSGKYSFSNVAFGDHTVTLDLNSLPVYYLPKTPLVKKITLSEGASYNYSIPLKRANP